MLTYLHYLLEERVERYSVSGLSPAVRVRGKIKRTFMRAPIVKPWYEFRYHARLGRHAEKLPWITKNRFDLVAELRDRGIAIRDAANMIPVGTLNSADRFVDSLRAITIQKPTLGVLADDLAADPLVYKWGLTDENLDLAEFYIGLPVRYLGVGVKRESADGVAAGVRQWHRDIEDRRMLKIIVYLSDVEDGCGPFEYVDRNASDHAAQQLDYSSGFVSDTALARVVAVEDLDSGHRAPLIGDIRRHQPCFPPSPTADKGRSILDDIHLFEHRAPTDFSIYESRYSCWPALRADAPPASGRDGRVALPCKQPQHAVNSYSMALADVGFGAPVHRHRGIAAHECRRRRRILSSAA